MKKKWTEWVSWRFLTGRRGGRGRIIFMFSVVLIAGGVATLNTILAVMNGLQQGYISSILEIGSYHLEWVPQETGNDQPVYEEIMHTAEYFKSLPEIKLVIPYIEGQTMLNGSFSSPSGAMIRGVPENIYIIDKSLSEKIKITDGNFDLSGMGIVLGVDLADKLGVSSGDTVTALDLGNAGFNSSTVSLEVKGLFSCGYSVYNSALSFVSLETAESLFSNTGMKLGIKLKNPEHDRRVISNVSSGSDFKGDLLSWREVNKAFFGALRMEKTVMLILLTLIFIVVAVNIDHSLRRMAVERTEDLALLKAIGASPGEIRILFLRHGLYIGGIGSLSGSLAGVLIGRNVEQIIHFFKTVFGRLREITGSGYPVYSPVESFFRNTQVMVKDVVTIFSVALILSFIAAFRAASIAAGSNPAEVLRSE